MLNRLMSAFRQKAAQDEPRRCEAFEDSDLVFFMPVFRDADVAFRALARLRRHYPGSRVIVLSDGDDDFPGDQVRERFDAEFVLGENLYGIERGGEMVQRILDHYLQEPAKWLVRLDSDARIDRRFSWLPDEDGLYGNVGERSGTVQGGIVVLTDRAARRLHESGVLVSDALRDDPAGTWGRYSTKENLDRKLRLGSVAYDKVLHWACIETGVPVRGFDEVYSIWKPAEGDKGIANEDGRYAVVHPDKMTGEAA